MGGNEVEQPDPATLLFTATHRGVVLRKTYLFDRDGYSFRLRLEVDNGTDRHLRPTFRTTWPAKKTESDDYREFNVVVYTDGDLQQFPILPPPSFLGFGGSPAEEPESFRQGVDWAGAQSRYFLAALVPDNPKDAGARFVPVDPGTEALVEVAFAPADVPPGGRLDRELHIYLGPKEPQRLEAMGFKIKQRDDLYRQTGYLAGPDETRAEELMAAFNDPEVDAIFPEGDVPEADLLTYVFYPVKRT